MLLDPLEEQFHLPTALLEGADARGRQGHLVGYEDERLAGLGVFEAHATQAVVVALPGVVAIQSDGLVADEAGTAIRLGRIDSGKPRANHASGAKVRLARVYLTCCWRAMPPGHDGHPRGGGL